MDSDDDSDGYRRPSILPVANFDDFDPSKPPASGEEYLRRVQLEAETCPDIVVAQFDVNSFRGQQTEILSNTNGFNPVTFEDRIPVDKQHEIVAYFTSLRMRVSGMRNRTPMLREGSVLEKEGSVLEKEGSVLEKEGSVLEKEGSVLEKEREKEEVLEKTPSINDHQAWRRYIMNGSNGESEGKDPHLTLLFRFDQVGHHKLLKYLHRWITEDGFCETIGLWIFSLLASLEKPIHSDIYATLRDISRTLSSERKENDLHAKDIKSINILICIIGRYFDQKDMLDE